MGWGYFDIEIRVVDNQLTKFELNPDNWAELEDFGWVLKPEEKVKFIIDENGTTGYQWQYDPDMTGGAFEVHSTYITSG